MIKSPILQVTGGRNGYGAKLANIFSTEFVIETCDGSRQKRYRQVFSKNMTKKGDPKISACKATDNWTCVEFKPDFARFNMDSIEEDTVALMRKRTYDLSGVLGSTVKVYYNGQRLAVKTFQDYVNLYLGPKDNGVPRVHEKVGPRWEIVVSPTDGQFQQVQHCAANCSILNWSYWPCLVQVISWV
jgi:DNA topoisomerase II